MCAYCIARLDTVSCHFNPVFWDAKVCIFVMEVEYQGLSKHCISESNFRKRPVMVVGLQYEALPVAHQKKYRDVFRSGYFFRPKGASPKHNPAVCNLQSSASIHRFDPNSLLYILKVCSILSDHCPYAMMSIIPSII